MTYGKCKMFGFSLIQWLKSLIRTKKGWILLGVSLSGLDKSEEES